MTIEGLTTLSSQFDPADTIRRLKSEIAAGGLTLFAAIDHAMNAQEAGLSLRPTTVLIFGNAKGGTALMAEKQTMGIDLPLKALVWCDAAGATWISYNDPVWLASRHGVVGNASQTAAKLGTALDAIVKRATQRDTQQG